MDFLLFFSRWKKNGVCSLAVICGIGVLLLMTKDVCGVCKQRCVSMRWWFVKQIIWRFWFIQLACFSFIMSLLNVMIGFFFWFKQKSMTSFIITV